MSRTDFTGSPATASIVRQNARRTAPRPYRAPNDPLTGPAANGCRISLRDMQIAYTDIGSDTPIVLIRGSGSSRRQWDAVGAMLAARHRVLAPDLPGHGESSALPAGVHDIRNETAVVRAMSIVAGAPLHLVGHAYGSFVALAAAAELGPRVASLTLIEPAIFPPRQAWDEDADWIEIEAWSARHLALARAAILAQLPQVGAGWEMTGAAHVDRATFAVAHAPALVLEGAGSTYAVRRVQACLFGLLPRATLLRFADAGDMLPVTHADEVAAAIARHVAGDETPAEADAQRLLQEESSASRCAAPARGVNRASRAR
jgi:pimeloyl-ACP methyl ester carboxylesterase